MRSRLGPALLVSLPVLAVAHTAPSPDVNNRYLKATLLPDEVRVSFTLFLGDRPGATERRRVDANGDGRLDEAEARAFGQRLLAELAPALRVSLDGKSQSGWVVADVGLGNPTVAGGALSLDLSLPLRYADPSVTTHTLSLDDDTVVVAPGESETRIEESPGVRLVECRRADGAAPGLGLEGRFAFTGNPKVRGEREIRARFTVPPGAPAAGKKLWLGVAVLVLAASLGAVGLYWRVWRTWRAWRARRPA